MKKPNIEWLGISTLKEVIEVSPLRFEEGFIHFFCPGCKDDFTIQLSSLEWNRPEFLDKNFRDAFIHQHLDSLEEGKSYTETIYFIRSFIKEHPLTDYMQDYLVYFSTRDYRHTSTWSK